MSSKLGIRWPTRVLLGMSIALASLSLTSCGRFSSAPSGSSHGQETYTYKGTDLDGAAPDFRLTDQDGTSVALSDFRGKVVVVAFLDPECTDVCPVTANEFRLTAEKLGEDAGRVVFLVVNVNPQRNSLGDVAGATRKRGIQDLQNWHYVTGTRDELEPIYRAYYVLAEGPPKPDKPSELEHTPGAYIIDMLGQKRWYISTNFEGAPPLHELLPKQISALLNE